LELEMEVDLLWLNWVLKIGFLEVIGYLGVDEKNASEKLLVQ